MAGDVGRVDRARRAGGAERALVELALLVPREDAAPALELVDVARRLAREDLDRVLVAEVVRALDRVERVRLGVVVGLVAERRVDAPLRGAGVAARRVELRDDGDAGAGVVRLDRGAHAGAAGADDEHVERGVHRLETIGWSAGRDSATAPGPRGCGGVEADTAAPLRRSARLPQSALPLGRPVRPARVALVVHARPSRMGRGSGSAPATAVPAAVERAAELHGGARSTSSRRRRRSGRLRSATVPL